MKVPKKIINLLPKYFRIRCNSVNQDNARVKYDVITKVIVEKEMNQIAEMNHEALYIKISDFGDNVIITNVHSCFSK